MNAKFAAGILALGMLWAGCQKELSENTSDSAAGKASPTRVSGLTSTNDCSTPYIVTLESRTNNGNGTWTWTWSIQNPNPGNGTNGTLKDLSHWAFQLGPCLKLEEIVSASQSANGIDWTSVPVVYQEDKSQTCIAGPVFKFGLGTSGSNKSYYRLVINQNYGVTNATASFKAGNGCCIFSYPGVGCPEGPVPYCSFSQGFWFAKPDNSWPDVNGAAYGNMTIGSFDYTQAEGMAIWNSSNTGGIPDAKKCFLQVAAIKLSAVDAGAPVWTDVQICENWLSSLGYKLTPTNLRNSSNAEAAAAAGRIGDWINENHCED